MKPLYHPQWFTVLLLRRTSNPDLFLCDKTCITWKLKKNYYLFHGLCRLWEGGQADQVPTITKELMNELEESVNLNVMSILKEM